jgi:hypothetical protein
MLIVIARIWRKIKVDHPIKRDEIIYFQRANVSPQLADTVEKLDKNGGLFFCRKAKHSELLSALTM